MTVKELKEKLESIPDDIEVFVPSVAGDYDYGLANSAKLKELIRDDFDEEITAFVIDEQ